MKRQPDKSHDDAIRRLHRDGLNDSSIAEQLGVQRRFVCSHRRRMGLAVNYERWAWRVKAVAGHDRTIRSMYARGAFDLEIARACGCGKRAVSLRRAELGLPTLDRKDVAARLATHDDLIRKRISEGWSGSEIAREIGGRVTQREVGMRRAYLGLPASGNNDRRRRKVAEKTREQLQRAGLPSLAYLRVEAFKRFAERHGWPEELAPRCVQILELLFDREWMLRRDIAAAIGMNVEKCQANWMFDSVNETTYLSTLQKLGWVVRSPRVMLPGVLPGKWKMVGRSVHLYGLTAVARERKELFNERQKLSIGLGDRDRAGRPAGDTAAGERRGAAGERRRSRRDC